MKTIITKSYDDYCDIAANIIFATCIQDKRVNVSITAGTKSKRCLSSFITFNENL